MPGSPSAFHPAPHLAGTFPVLFPGGGCPCLLLSWESLGRLPPHPHQLPTLWVAGISLFPTRAPAGFYHPGFAARSPFSRCLDLALSLHELRSASTAFASWESWWGRPRASPYGPRAEARAPRKAEAPALWRALGLPGEGSADPASGGGLASAPVVFPGGTKSPRVPTPWDPDSRFRLEWGAGNAAWKLWGPGPSPGPRAISGLRRHRRSRLYPCTS